MTQDDMLTYEQVRNRADLYLAGRTSAASDDEYEKSDASNVWRRAMEIAWYGRELRPSPTGPYPHSGPHDLCAWLGERAERHAQMIVGETPADAEMAAILAKGASTRAGRQGQR